MFFAWKLALSYAVRHPARMLLTSLATIASACIVVWVVSGYDALSSRFGEQATEYLGRYDFFVVPEDAADPTIGEELVAALRNDPMAAAVDPVAQVQARIINPNAPIQGPGARGQGSGGRGQRSEVGGQGSEARGQRGDAANLPSPASGRGAGGEGGKNLPSPIGRGAGGEGSPNRGKQNPASPHPNPLPKGEGTKMGDLPKGEGTKPGGPGAMMRRMMMPSPVLVGTDARQPPHPMLEGVWIDPAHPEQRGAVITKPAAGQMSLKLGDEALVIIGMKEYRVKIAGIVEGGGAQPGRGMPRPQSDKPRTGIAAGPAASALYVPLALAKHFTRGKARINLVNVQLKPEAKSKTAAFRKTWEERIARVKPAASLLGVDDIRSGIEEGMMARRSRNEAWAATGLALLAALFIIFTTLSMGVTERIRQFAVMRAVGLTRGQVARVIAAEGLILALIGWGGGLLAGWGLLAVVAKMNTGLFAGGASLGVWCVVLTGVSAVGGALAASVLPAWRAMRVQPLEAMSPRRSARPNLTVTTALGLAGLALIAVNPAVLYVASGSVESGTMSSDKLYGIYAAVGCSTMAVGFLLLTPAMILFVEGAFGPWLARLLGIEPRLLRWQLGGNLWRTLGTTAALTVGLGLFTAMQIWGYSMLEPFKPGDWNPDLLVAFQRGGLPDDEIAAVQSISGVVPGKCIPLAVEQPKLAADITGSEKHSSVISQNNVIMIGLDPAVAFGGSDPLVKARFVEGDADGAIAKLKEGRNCIVPDHFLRATNLKLGDRFSMVPPDAPSKRVEYTIVGVVSLPGWHWMTKFSGLRRREGRSAAIVFADYDKVRKDFQLNQINFFWMDVDDAYGEKHFDEAVKISERLKSTAARPSARSPGGGPSGGPTQPASDGFVDQTIEARRAAVLLVGNELQKIADRNLGDQQPVNAQGAWAVGATMFGQSARVSTPADVGFFIMRRASGMIWASCYLPLITLLVTSLGVVNTVMASVRARRWEFGVLRSQGVTRSGLFRMILAEGILIGLITCILSLGFGILSGWCGTGISQYVSFFGGLAPPLIIPWAQLSVGFGLAMGLCLLAALWPAVLTGRTEPLKLLQAGRADM